MGITLRSAPGHRKLVLPAKPAPYDIERFYRVSNGGIDEHVITMRAHHLPVLRGRIPRLRKMLLTFRTDKCDLRLRHESMMRR